MYNDKHTQQNKFRIIVAGSRDFTDYVTVKFEVLDAIEDLQINYSDVQIVSGGARGVDSLGERLARELGFHLKVFPADWNKHGRRAGPLRNIQMGDYADALVAIRVNNSKGTTHMIDYMLGLDKPVYVFDLLR